MPIPIIGGLLSKVGTKIVIALMILLALAGFWIRGDHFQKRALRLETKLAETEAKLTEQITKATSCTADLKRLEEENAGCITKISNLQTTCNATVTACETQLRKMSEERYTEVTITGCDRIVQVEQDPILEELRKGVDR